MSNYNLDDPVELLCALTEINSVNSTLVPGAPGESEIATFIGKWFTDRGFEVTRLEGTPGRPSIVACSKGATSSKKIMLNGHIDTVTIASYDGDGCKAVRKDGNVYGRGTFDMKGGLAGQMIAAHRAVQQGITGQVIVAAVSDEEHGNIGTEEVLKHFTADVGVVAEPTMLGLTVAHKGFVWFDLTINGLAAHGSRHDLGIDAITKAGYALVAFGEGPLEGRLVGREGEVRLGPGEILRVYGGQNELVRFHVEGLLSFPGLFSPNLWGQLSLGLLWIMEAAYRFTGNWGLAILFLTLVVRLLLWPLMHQQFKSMAEIQRLQPLIQKINEKYKDDPNKRAEATMKLYQEHRVNPAAGCLPLLIQMPILFILWKVIANYEFGQGFLWIPDLALPDPYYILPVLYVASTFLSTWLSAHGNRDLIRQSLFMNLIFVFLVLQFPSGVTLYWVLSTLIGLVQQWLINKSLAPLKA